MADWRLLAQNLALVDGRIGAWDAQVIEAELWADGKIDNEELKFVIDLRRGAQSVVVEFEDLIFSSIERVLLKNGDISPDKTEWLKGFVKSDDQISQRERRFLKDLMESSKSQCKEFVAWCDSLGIQAVPPGYRKPKKSDPAPPRKRPEPRPAAAEKPAGFMQNLKDYGVISFAMAALIVVWLFILVLVTARSTPNSGPQLTAGGLIVVTMFLAPFYSLAGLIIGIIGRYRSTGVFHRLCAFAGTLFHLFIVLIYGLLLFAVIISTPNRI